MSTIQPSKRLPYQEEFARLLESMIYAKKRFQVLPDLMHYNFPDRKELGSYGLMIEDYVWWMDTERDILNWMVDHLPHGIEHQQGMMVYFPTEQDRVMFLLKWGG